MGKSVKQEYYKAVWQAAAAMNSEMALEQVLNAIVRGTARAMNAGASLVLLDSDRKKLIHSSSWRLPKSYLNKGVLDAHKSLVEVIMGQPVAIADVKHDSRVQYPEPAVKAGITSMLGVPLMIDGVAAGSIRVYTKEPNEFTQTDINFATTMANLAAVAIQNRTLFQEKRGGEQAINRQAVLRQARSVHFVHPSEEEVARLLDFYNIEWVYEPRSFPLKWEDERVTEMFTPDFYLPGLDLYVELTTLKQSLVTKKNRKLRQLRELYPEINITLLYKKDFDRLLAKYGCGPLAQSRGHSVSRVLYPGAEIQRRVQELAKQISLDYADRRPIMVGVLRGVVFFMVDLVRQMTIPLEVEFMSISYYGTGDSSAVKITKDMDLNVAGRDVMMVEDIVDTGMTLNYILNYIKAKGPASLAVCTLLDKRTRRIVDVPLDYTGFEVPDEFLVGYGLDYRQEYRNLPFIGILGSEDKKTESGSSGSSNRRENCT
ncbi:hypoxanthine phosphoribosyltransferase [Chloroflexota bacterium]